jgi:DNA-directed RNA polymerase specialized sigma24 family protein
MTDVADDELLQRAIQGSESALGELYDRHSPTAYALARALAPEPDDVLLDAFSDLVAAGGKGAAHGSVRANLVGAVRRRALAQIRGRGTKRAITFPSGGAMEPALRQLGVSEREAVQFANAGLNEAQIAQRLEEAPAAIRARIRTGMEKLREVLAGPKA